MRLVFAGTPDFARVALQALVEAGHVVALVLTQPDRPAGRGMKLQESAVKTYARAHGLAVAQPRSLRLDGRYPEDAAAARALLLQAGADAMVVAAYGLLLPRWVLEAMRAPGASGRPGLGCLNIHGSLLPRWRGAAPIHRAIEAGDACTGVTIMQMDEGLDTGAMLLSDSCPIEHAGPDADTTDRLHDRLAALGASLILRALDLAQAGRLSAVAQPLDGVTYARKVDKPDARLDWSLAAEVLDRRVRAFHPAPGAWTTLGTEVLKVWRATAVPMSGPPAHGVPGTVVAAGDGGVDVICGGGGLLRIAELQRAGGKRLAAGEFLRGFALQAGTRLGAEVADGCSS